MTQNALPGNRAAVSWNKIRCARLKTKNIPGKEDTMKTASKTPFAALTLLLALMLSCVPNARYKAVYTIGPEGGTAASVDKRVSIVFPAGALAQATKVTIDSSPWEGAASPDLIDSCLITLDPAPDAPFEKGVVVHFLKAAGDYTVARYTEIPGQTGDEPLAGWRPVPNSRLAADGCPAAVVAGFSRYAAVSAEAQSCEPRQEDLSPPAAPDGYVYAGTHVMVNAVFRPEYSSGITHGSDSPDNTVLVSSYSYAADGTATCDVVVGHIYRPENSASDSCEVPDDMLAPLKPPDGYVFAGYDVLINSFLEKSTIPMTYTDEPDDINYISSRTVTRDSGLVCDIVVRQLFIPQDRQEDTGPFNPLLTYGEITDTRDGKTYKTIDIGGQMWLAENMAYASATGSWCWNDDSASCDEYGKLYDWAAAQDACPAGWSLPSDEDWKTLVRHIDPAAQFRDDWWEDSLASDTAGAGLKATTGWGGSDDPDTGATNETGWSALPGGFRGSYGDNYGSLGYYGYWWTATAYDEYLTEAWIYSLDYRNSSVFRETMVPEVGYSVRCLKK